MIFLTVGTQGPFDRLVQAVDQWAGRSGADVLAQVGPSQYKAQHIETKRFIHPDEFRKNVETARVIVAHAGMGSILTALEYGKPIVVMPRRCSLHEHRSDHQVDTAREFAGRGIVFAAFDEAELGTTLDSVTDPKSADKLSASASPTLIATIRAFFEQPTPPLWASR